MEFFNTAKYGGMVYMKNPDISKIVERARKAAPIIQELIKDLERIENEFSPTRATEEERSQVKHLRALCCRQFDEAGWRLDRMLFSDIIAQGTLSKNSSGRFEIEGTDHYFTCGSSCEAYLPYDEYYEDEENKLMTWVPTSIEATNGEYYFTASPNISMDGILVRIKKCK